MRGAVLVIVSTVVCPSCGVPFTRSGAARSSTFYRTAEENETCIVCREGLDPTTLERLPREEDTMKADTLSDGELLEAIDLAASRARLAAGVDLRKSADVLAGLALEAAARIRARNEGIDAWGVIGPRAIPCLFGAKRDAEENRDDDERVALFRVVEIKAANDVG